MIFDLLHTHELPWIHAVHSFRTPNLDTFFKALNFFDRPEFFMLLIPFVWYLCSPKWGRRLFFLVLASSLINGVLKSLFDQPRPFHIDPSLALLQLTSGGFPSGAAQTAIILPCLLINEWKSRLSWILGALFFLLLSFSRVYLGVHFFSDLVGGWLAGLGLMWAFYQYHERVETLSPPKFILLCASLIFACLLIAHNPSTLRAAFTALGSLAGLSLMKTWPRGMNLTTQCLQAFFTLGVLFALHEFSSVIAAALPPYGLPIQLISYFFTGLTAIYLAPLCLASFSSSID